MVHSQHFQHLHILVAILAAMFSLVSLVQDCVLTQSSGSEKGSGRTLVQSSGSEKGERIWPNPGSAGSDKGIFAEPWFGRVRQKVRSLEKSNGLNPGSAGSEFGERTCTDFGERTWPNPDSEFGFRVRRKERA